jgi:choice-of-anchor A domain-containing protein
MKTYSLLAAVILASLASCRTASDRVSTDIKQVEEMSACDPKGILNDLMPGGLFGATRVLYNQPNVANEWLHPVMIKKAGGDSLGLFQSFIPDPKQAIKVKKINSALATLAKDFGAAKAIDGRLERDAIEFKGTSDRLNVFKVDSADLSQRKVLKFAVSPKANSILVITGQTPSMSAIQIDGAFKPESLLYVAPEAATFRIQGGNFIGTIIAPKAAVFMEADFTGSIFGKEVTVRDPMKVAFYQGCVTTQKMP